MSYEIPSQLIVTGRRKEKTMSIQVEAVECHDFRPCIDEVVDELLARNREFFAPLHD